MSEEMQSGTPASTPAPEATASASSAPVASPTAEGVATQAATATPEWKPSWTYELADGKKGEIDEFFRPLAKDDETLKKLVDHHKRAALSEIYKKDMLEYKSRIGEYEPTVKSIEKLREWYGAGNHERVMQELGYTDEMIFQIAKEKLDRMKMEPQARQAFEQKRQAELAHEELLAQNELYKSQAMENLAKATQYELDVELGKADVQPIQEAYDKAYGSGAFKQLVIDRGSILVDRAGKHIPPSELIPMVAKEFAPFVQGQSAPGMAAIDPQNQSQLNQPVPAAAPAKPKVIPVVKGSGSPARGGVRSLDDLRKLSRG